MNYPKIRLPPEISHCINIASVSGGKDSTALILALREAQVESTFVFADTGWESDITYEYLDLLRSKLGIVIHQVGVEGGMEARCRHRAGFPGRMQRFCTRELKLEPLRAFHDKMEEETGGETVSSMGVRAEESERRSKMPEIEDEGPKFTRERWGGWVWRPLIAWTVEQVLWIHRRHAVPVNPLYQRGHNRVGCYPCIFSNKEEIALIAKHDPARIDKIRSLESELVQLRGRRNEETPGRYKHADDASFFQTQRQGFSGIDKVVSWAQTEHGGRQFSLFAPPPSGGCMRWGLCDTPSETPPEVTTWSGVAVGTNQEGADHLRVADDAFEEGRDEASEKIESEVA